MYNSKLIQQVREGKAAIELSKSDDKKGFNNLCREIHPIGFAGFSGLFIYYFINKDEWDSSDALPEGMIAIPFADFLKEESSVSEFPNNSPDLEAERRRFWCDIVSKAKDAGPDLIYFVQIADKALAAFDERFGK